MLALGLDFGTESVRALLVDVATGQECGEGVALYQHGVMDTELTADYDRSHQREPQKRVRIFLPPDYALQNGLDYLEAMKKAVAIALADMAQTTPHRSASEVGGIGTAFTASSPLPIKNGLPLSVFFPEEPHAYVKLWKHHGAQASCEFINNNAPWELLNRYGGAISCEWSLPKLLELAQEAPWVLESADHWIEAGDWIVSSLVGRGHKPVRSRCQAGYKGLWSEESGYPAPSFLKHCSSRLASRFEMLMAGPILPPGSAAGVLNTEGAQSLGLREGIPVAVASIDAHASVPGSGVCRHGEVLCVVGASTSHMALSRSLHYIGGIAGAVDDGIIPGLIGYEAGQPAAGDLFSWFLRLQRKPVTAGEFEALEIVAAQVPPGSNGVTALDWWNGNRSLLMDGQCRGTLVGMRLTTSDADVYRALVEATAFGTKVILHTMKQGGIPIERIVLSGGFASKSELLPQIYADVLDAPVDVVMARQPVAMGAAIYGASAAAQGSKSPQDFETLVSRMTAPCRTRRVEPQQSRDYNIPFERYSKLQNLMHRFYRHEYKG